MGSPFFPGYTLTAMLSAFIYALFFFRARISVLRILLCKLVINYGMNVLLGSLWRIILYGKGYLFYVSTSFLKNTILLPIEVLILFLLFSLLLKPLAHMGLTPPQPTSRIPIVNIRKKQSKEIWNHKQGLFENRAPVYCCREMSVTQGRLHAKYLHAKDMILNGLTFLEKENFLWKKVLTNEMKRTTIAPERENETKNVQENVV